MAISLRIGDITIVTLLITLLLATHEPPSIPPCPRLLEVWGLGLDSARRSGRRPRRRGSRVRSRRIICLCNSKALERQHLKKITSNNPAMTLLSKAPNSKPKSNPNPNPS